MAFTLGSITLPNPKKLTRNKIEFSVEHLLIFGRTTKRLQRRKEQFILEYLYLTQEVINSILSQYELGTVLPFTVTETNLSIPQTDVLMDIGGLEFLPSGEQMRESIIITLTEVE